MYRQIIFTFCYCLNFDTFTKYFGFVSDPPLVKLQLGSSLKPQQIKEGDDVYFECDVKANPRQHKISWYHNVSILYRAFKFTAVYFIMLS